MIRFTNVLMLVAMVVTCARGAEPDPMVREAGPGIRLTLDGFLAADWGGQLVRGLAVSPDGSMLAVITSVRRADRAAVRRIDPPSRLVVFELKSKRVVMKADVPGRVGRVVWQGDRLLTVGEQLDVWDVKTGKPAHTLTAEQAGGPLADAAVSPDGKTVAVTTLGSLANIPAGAVALWTPPDGRVVELWRRKPGTPELPPARPGVAFSNDGKTLAATGGTADTLRLWKLDEAKAEAELAPPSFPGEVREVMFPDDPRLVLAGIRCPGPAITAWDRRTGGVFWMSEFPALRNLVLPICVSRDGLFVFTMVHFRMYDHPEAAAHVYIVSMHTGKVMGKMELGGEPGGVAVIDERTLAVAHAGPDKAARVRLWQLDVDDQLIEREKRHRERFDKTPARFP